MMKDCLMRMASREKRWFIIQFLLTTLINKRLIYNRRYCDLISVFVTCFSIDICKISLRFLSRTNTSHIILDIDYWKANVTLACFVFGLLGVVFRGWFSWNNMNFNVNAKIYSLMCVITVLKDNSLTTWMIKLAWHILQDSTSSSM